jgi:outer membrane protein insertion porin family
LGRKVVEIRFEGNRRYTDEFLKEQISTKLGEVLDAALLARDERTLRDYFAAVTEIDEIEVEGGVELVFHVLDRIIVARVEFRGLARVKEEDFKALLATRPGRPLHEHALKSDKDLIARLHREKGYHFVEVESYLQATTKPDVKNVVFQVLTSKRVRIKEVILEGAHALERGTLLQGVKNSDTYRRKFLGLGKLFSPSFFNRAALEEDRRLVQMHYRREGYLDARVILVDVRFNDTRDEVRIHFRIEEGERYRVRSFKVEYAQGGEPQEADRAFLAPRALEGLATLLPGVPYRVEEVALTRRRIVERLRAKAYAKNTIMDRVHEVAATRAVDIVFQITAGPKVRLGQVQILGNRWTKDNVIRRQFRHGALPGDYLNLDSLEAARQRLIATRYFDMVMFGDRPGEWGLVKSSDPTKPDEYDLKLVLQEAETTRNFTLGAGINSDGGAFGQFTVTWRNFDIGRPPDRIWNLLDEHVFRGGGQTFSISLAPGTTFSTFQVAFSDPALRDSRWSLSSNVWRRLALFDTYDQTTDGIRFGVGRYLDPRFRYRLNLDWSLRQVRLDNPDPNAPVNMLDDQGTSVLHGIGFSVRRVARREADPFLNGHITAFGASLFGTFLGGDKDLVKTRLSHSAGWRFLRQRKGGWHRFRVNFSTDWATALNDTAEVPIYERYFLGGRNLRGFEYREVGPKSNGSPTGGEFMVLLSMQYTVPIVVPDQGFGVDFVLFLDQGGVSLEFDRWTSDSWRVSAGFGLAISFGGGNQPPLIIDFGWPLRSQPTDVTQVVGVSFERNF